MFKSLSRSAERGGAVTVLPTLVASRLNRANACGNTLASGGSNPPVGRLIDRFLASTCRPPGTGNEWRMQAALQG